MIEIKNLTKTFIVDGHYLNALKDVSLTIEDGDIFGIIGMSGAGKSTLVRCINMLEKPTEGSIIIDGVKLNTLKESELRAKRREITMIFQGFNLLMQRTCLKNVLFPLELAGASKAESKKRAMELLQLVGLEEKANAYPAQLSGGQQQRIAIARALATNPKVLLCDEATSALDPTTTHQILELIREINEKTGITVIIITHQMSVVESVCKHVAILDEGTVCEQGEVSEVFSKPKTKAAKKLVFPEGEADYAPSVKGEKLLRVVFNGAESAKTPLIAKMALEKGVEANIVFASTRNLGDKTFGSMLLSFKTKEELRTATDFVADIPGVICEEVQG